MPGKKETLAQLLSLINTPATQFVRLLQAPGSQVVQVLGAYQRKLEGAAQ
jgi:ribosomal protein L10